MQNSLSKVALITGAGRRVGAQLAKYLHAKGMRVIIHYHHSKVDAEVLCAELNAIRPQSAASIHCDLLNTVKLSSLIDQVMSIWGRLDVLVNNASKFYKTFVGNITQDIWDDLMNVNVKAPLFLSQAAAPYLSDTYGVIVNIADIHGDKPLPEYPLYSMTKAGLIMMTKALAAELGPKIRVNAVSPGAVSWPEGDNKLSSQTKRKIIARTFLKRHGDAQAIAKAVWYLINDADYVTGVVLNVDGGRSLAS